MDIIDGSDSLYFSKCTIGAELHSQILKNMKTKAYRESLVGPIKNSSYVNLLFHYFTFTKFPTFLKIVFRTLPLALIM